MTVIQDLLADLIWSASIVADKVGGVFGFEESGSGMREYADKIHAEAEELRNVTDSLRAGKLEKIKLKYAESVPKTDSSFVSADINNLGLQNIAGIGGGSSGGGGGSGAGAFTELNREIDRLNTEINEAKDRAIDLQSEFNNFALEMRIEGMSEFEKVYANIDKEKLQRLASVDEWMAKFNNATIEAQQMYERAMKTGDANVLASAQEMLAQRQAAEAAALIESKAMRSQIMQEAMEQELSAYTEMQAYKAELDELYRQGDLEGYLLYLDSEKAAFLQQMEEKQELMDAYQQWRMEAESTYTSFAIDAANTLKTGLAQGFADAIVNGQSLGKTFQNLGKEILAMFIKWKAQQLISQLLVKSGLTESAALAASVGKSVANSTREAALYLNMISGGTLAPAAATSIQLALTSLAVMGGGASGGGDVSQTGISAGAGTSAFDQADSYLPGFANGGIVTGTTIGVIGEKSYDEAVIPLRSSVLESLASYLIPGMQSTGTDSDVTVNVNNYGDINNGSDYDDLMNDIAASVAAGTRGVRFAT